MLTLGLTGGIGSGKSAAGAHLASLGCAVIDADRVAREVVDVGTPGLAEVVAVFGPGVLRSDGSLDRPGLGRRVFADDRARERLNAIVHPRIGARTGALMEQARSTGAQVLVHDVPLLLENGLGPGYHLVAVVHAPPALRLRRLAGRGLPPDQARARMAVQATQAQRRAAADVWLDNSRSRGALEEQVGELYERRLLPYADHLRRRTPAPRPPVTLRAPDPGWPVAGRRLVARLRHLCPGALAVEHIGSTAVPGLAAKDTVDLQVEVADWAAVEALVEPLSAGGFPHRSDVHGDPVRPELDPDAAQYRKHLHLSADPGRAANVHVRVSGSTSGRAAVALRDLLRADPAVRRAYESEKARLAARHGNDVDAYAEGKTAVLLPWLLRELPPGR